LDPLLATALPDVFRRAAASDSAPGEQTGRRDPHKVGVGGVGGVVVVW